MTEMQNREVEELLEAVYTGRELGKDDIQSVLAHATMHAGGKASHHDLVPLQEQGLIRLDGTRLVLTEAGELRAAQVVRRHRLAERLFKDLLDVSETTMESHACEFEHVLSVEATDSVCTLLGHPPTCPHGKPIPKGECCSTFQKTVRPLITGLTNMELGTTGRIVFITPKFHDRMDRLAALGIIPGTEIRLHQRAPSYVIEVGETTVALDGEIAGEIYVKRTES